MHIDHRTPLRKAVDQLIADGKVKQDKDLQEIFELSKSTISAYLNNPKPGKRFVNEFEKKFGISLKEFEGAEVQVTTNYDNTLIEALKGQIKLLEKLDDLQKKVDKLEISLNEGQANLAVLFALLKETATQSAHYRYGTNKKKLDNELNEINKVVVSFHT